MPWLANGGIALVAQLVVAVLNLGTAILVWHRARQHRWFEH